MATKSLSSRPVTVLIVTDIRIYREALTRLFERQQRFRLIDAVADAGAAFDRVRAAAPELVLVDLAMPDSFATARAIIEIAPDAKVVALSAESERDFLATAEAGMTGAVMRHDTFEELLAALESAVRGETRCSPRMAAGLLRHVAVLAATQPDPPAPFQLTRRELEIVPLLDRGFSNKEIGQRLGIEPATVKNHVHNILDKLQVHRRAEAGARLRPALSGRHEPSMSVAG